MFCVVFCVLLGVLVGENSCFWGVESFLEGEKRYTSKVNENDGG